MAQSYVLIASYLLFAIFFLLFWKIEKSKSLLILSLLFALRFIVTLVYLDNRVIVSWISSGFRIAIGAVIICLICKTVVKYWKNSTVVIGSNQGTKK